MYRTLTYFGSIFNGIIIIILDVGTWYDLFELNRQKGKNYSYFWDVFFTLWILWSLRRDSYGSLTVTSCFDLQFFSPSWHLARTKEFEAWLLSKFSQKKKKKEEEDLAPPPKILNHPTKLASLCKCLKKKKKTK